MWNEKIAEQFERWSMTPAGAYAVACRDRLLRQLAYGWPRRGRKVVMLGCGVGTMLKTLWEDGFDVTGFDVTQNLLAHASSKLGTRAEYRLGVMDDLPFEDGEFDYAVIPYCYEFFENRQTVLNEALRVAACGAVVLFSNRLSVFPLCRGAVPFADLRTAGLWPWAVYSSARTLDPSAHLTMRSILPTPPPCWSDGRILKRINRMPMLPPLGAIAGLRIDKTPSVPVTPIWLTEKDMQEEGC